jgi:hypothetical protein
MELLYCEECGYEAESWRFEKGGDLEQYERVKGKWFICPSCSRGRMLKTRTPINK